MGVERRHQVAQWFYHLRIRSPKEYPRNLQQFEIRTLRNLEGRLQWIFARNIRVKFGVDSGDSGDTCVKCHRCWIDFPVRSVHFSGSFDFRNFHREWMHEEEVSSWTNRSCRHNWAATFWWKRSVEWLLWHCPVQRGSLQKMLDSFGPVWVFACICSTWFMRWNTCALNLWMRLLEVDWELGFFPHQKYSSLDTKSAKFATDVPLSFNNWDDVTPADL